MDLGQDNRAVLNTWELDLKKTGRHDGRTATVAAFTTRIGMRRGRIQQIVSPGTNDSKAAIRILAKSGSAHIREHVQNYKNRHCRHQSMATHTAILALVDTTKPIQRF
jgi:hypothetical protein